MAGPIGHHVTMDPASEKGEIPEHVSDLVSQELVIEAQVIVHHTVLADHDGVFE